MKCSLNMFFFIDQDTYWTHQDTYWTQPNGCLNCGMFYLEKLHLLEEGNLVLAKSICRSMKYSHKIITRNDFKTSNKLAMAYQLNNADFPVLCLNMCVKLFLVELKSCQINLSVKLLLNLFVNLFVFVNLLVPLCLLNEFSYLLSC